MGRGGGAEPMRSGWGSWFFVAFPVGPARGLARCGGSGSGDPCRGYPVARLAVGPCPDPLGLPSVAVLDPAPGSGVGEGGFRGVGGGSIPRGPVARSRIVIGATGGCGDPVASDGPGADRTATDSGSDRGIHGGSPARGHRVVVGAVSGQSGLRRAVGSALVGCRRVCRLQRLFQRRHGSAAGLPLPRLRGPIDQQRQTLRPVDPGAIGGRRIGGMETRGSCDAGDPGSARGHPLPAQRSGRHRGVGRQSRRGSGRPLLCPGSLPADHRVEPAGTHRPVCQVSRPQVRTLHPP